MWVSGVCVSSGLVVPLRHFVSCNCLFILIAVSAYHPINLVIMLGRLVVMLLGHLGWLSDHGW